MTPPRRELPPFDPAALQALLDGPHAAVLGRVRATLSQPELRPLPPETPLELQRAYASRGLQILADSGVGALAFPREYGGEDDWPGFLAAFEAISAHDVGLAIKCTVHFGLWSACLLLLGNEAQARRCLPDSATLRLPGCFALSEIGHGSNARAMETTATYDPAADGFVLHSPRFESGKNYIGNAARDARVAVVFAQLHTLGEAQGLHGFIVPLRDEGGGVLPGVRIEDNGPKMGENGVDNARIWFDQVRVGRDALLDRLGGVEPGGRYVSAIADPGKRFLAMISALVGGRIAIASAAIGVAKTALAIAVRYALHRRQGNAGSGSAGAEESLLLEYPTHQRRLMPLLARLYALDFAHKRLVRRRVALVAAMETESGADAAATATESRALEGLAAGIKAWAAWHCTCTVQTCREACGGEGYMTVNRLPALKADSDIFTTFEGDNTVLTVWLGRSLLSTGKADDGAEDDGPPPGAGTEDPAGWRVLFAGRVEALRRETRAESARLKAAGMPPAEVAARLQTACFRLAAVHLESVLLEALDDASEEAADQSDPAVGEALAAMRELFALESLEESRGWFLERGWLPPAEARALTGRVEDLCARLAGRARELVDAFGLPDATIGAPIAFGGTH